MSSGVKRTHLGSDAYNPYIMHDMHDCHQLIKTHTINHVSVCSEKLVTESFQARQWEGMDVHIARNMCILTWKVK